MNRRGAILFEILLSIALFAGAGAYCLACTRSVLDSLDRARRQAEALDLARSKLSELETGVISITQLEAPWSGEVGSHQPTAREQIETGLPWRIDVQSEASEFGDLSLVRLIVTEATAREDRSAPVSVTLRALLPLREPLASEFEHDDLLDDLPPPAPPPEGAPPAGSETEGAAPPPPVPPAEPPSDDQAPEEMP
jgi:hypothetical protein